MNEQMWWYLSRASGPETGAGLLADAMVPAVMTMDDGTTDCVGGWQEYER